MPDVLPDEPSGDDQAQEDGNPKRHVRMKERCRSRGEKGRYERWQEEPRLAKGTPGSRQPPPAKLTAGTEETRAIKTTTGTRDSRPVMTTTEMPRRQGCEDGSESLPLPVQDEYRRCEKDH